MNDDWLESMGWACVVVIVFVGFIGLITAPLVFVLSKAVAQSLSGIGLWIGFIAFVPMVGDLILLCWGLCLEAHLDNEIRMRGMLLFGGAIGRLLLG